MQSIRKRRKINLVGSLSQYKEAMEERKQEDPEPQSMQQPEDNQGVT